jgi:predicted transglutaminase-like cysteine proteinase
LISCFMYWMPLSALRPNDEAILVAKEQRLLRPQTENCTVPVNFLSKAWVIQGLNWSSRVLSVQWSELFSKVCKPTVGCNLARLRSPGKESPRSSLRFFSAIATLPNNFQLRDHTASIKDSALGGLPLLRMLRLAVLSLFWMVTLAWGSDTAMLIAAKNRSPLVQNQVRALQDLISNVSNQEDDRKLDVINQFFNRRVLFSEDTDVWGQIDYWASPFEMFDRGRGDCEDYAIGKYFTLTTAGVPINKLRLVYVRAQLGGNGGPLIAHMVLAYYPQPDADPLILDNLVTQIRPASRRLDLQPVFSFNGEGLWRGVGAQPAQDPTSRLSRWRDVQEKARAEGFK